MASRKRWSEVYAGENPLAMPQTIARHLRSCANENRDRSLQYLWIMLDAKPSQEMATEHWLNVVDEAASLGVTTLVVTIDGPLSARREVIELCRWALDTHDMRAGIHLSDPTLSPADVSLLESLASSTFFVFVRSADVPTLKAQLSDRIRIIEADGLEDGVAQPHCELPEQMSCVGEHGGLYTCGLVLGRDGFLLGHANASRLSDVCSDGHLPHCIPAGTSQESHRCEGCPPLLEERIRKALQA